MNISRSAFGLLLIVLIVITPQMDTRAGGYNLAGAGAKGLAMAGAFHAVADDWSAMYWNPAGLSGQSNAITISSKVLNPTVYLTPNVTSAYPNYLNDVEHTTEATSYLAGAFGLTYGINEQWTAGLSIFAPSALGADWCNLYTGPPAGYGNDVPYPEQAWFSDIKVIDIHPTVAYQVTEQLSLGLGVAIQHGSITLQSPKKQLSGAPAPWHEFYIDATLEGQGWGFGYNIGAMYEINDKWKVGVAYRGPGSIPIEGTVKQTLILPTSVAIQQAMPDMAFLFGGGCLEAEPDGEADFPIPMDLGLGIAYHPTEELTIAFDALWTQWSTADIIKIKLDGTGPTGAPAEDSELILCWEDVWKFSVGFDYLMCQDHGMTVRGGYYFDPSPIPDGSIRPSISDVADKHNISLGLAWAPPTSNFTLEGYWEHLFSETRTVESIDLNGDGEIDNLAGEWKFNVDTFGLSISYRFGGAW
ncbi:MAG: outer membrane protein transport protein [Candidatus Electryoneaceae bacterium]|nr:outer membrane protein transport protein [Candidatus Electryoneaceae bacterium]